MTWFLKKWIRLAKVIAWGYRIFLNPLFTFAFNSYYLVKITITGNIFTLLREKREITKTITSITKLIYEYKNFRYIFDGFYNKVGKQTLLSKWPTWVPLVIVFLYRNKKDNCEGATVYAKWLLKALKKNSPEARKRFQGTTEVIVPYTFPAMALGPHYIYVLSRKGETDKTLPDLVLSNGKASIENKEDFGDKFVGNKEYLWM